MTERTGRKSSPKFLSLKYKSIRPNYTKKYHTLDLDCDIKIFKLYEERGDDWSSISKEMDDMDPIKIRNRYYSHIFKRQNLIKEEIQAREKAEKEISKSKEC
mmetsp:Transcript_36686/g.32886  ORF Transcript_36686/g.32886 Transcript_36686/m.32886 type:complete len:102 (+) Transcript_36686:576-881(+)